MIRTIQRALLLSIALAIPALASADDTCSRPLPVPANADAIKCVHAANARELRCGARLDAGRCRAQNQYAFESGLITLDAYLWANGWDNPNDPTPPFSRVPNTCAISVAGMVFAACPPG